MKKIYDVVWTDAGKSYVYMCITARNSKSVAEWFINHFGAVNPQVTICDNPNAQGAMVVII